MEELLERLVIAVEQQNSAFPWDSVISILALIASWVTIFFLLKERSEKNRPYMQISFELVRSTLACIVLRKNCELTKEEIINLVKEAGVVGMGGAGFPTHVKL